MVNSLFNIPYLPSSEFDIYHQFDLHLPTHDNNATNQEPKPLICFVHGGAWRSKGALVGDGLSRPIIPCLFHLDT